MRIAISGFVETDEPFFSVAHKRQRVGLSRTSKMRRCIITETGKGAETVAMLVAQQRDTRQIFNVVLPNTSAMKSTKALRSRVRPAGDA